MQDKNQTKPNFFKRNIYYFIIAFILISAIAITVVLFLTGNNGVINTVDTGSSSVGGTVEIPKDSSLPENPTPSLKPDDSGSGGEDVGDTTPPDSSQPTQKPMTFIVPVDNSTIICDYTATSVVYNKTLGIYTGHLAIDFSAEQGAEVKAVFDGTIESIVTTYLTGTTVTVAHENGVKTVYNSIEVPETLTVGKAVSQGEVIGFVSDNNKQEYKDGPHLHFEVYENGVKISPYKYLAISEK